MHVRTMEADDDGNVVEEVVIVATDIAAPKPVAFEKFEADEDGTLTQVLNARDLDATDDANDDNNPANDFTALTVEAGTDGVNLPLIMSDAFVPGAGTDVTELTFDREQEDGDPAVGDQPVEASKPRAPTTARWAHTGATPPTAATTARSHSTRTAI